MCTNCSWYIIAGWKGRMAYFLGTWVLDDKGEIWGHANSTGVLFLPELGVWGMRQWTAGVTNFILHFWYCPGNSNSSSCWKETVNVCCSIIYSVVALKLKIPVEFWFLLEGFGDFVVLNLYPVWVLLIRWIK